MPRSHDDAGPRVVDQEYELVHVDELHVHPRNPNQGDVGEIIQSIEANGFVGALWVQRGSGYVIAGNHRLLAAMQQGIEEVPVIWLDVDDEQAERLLLMENRIARLGANDDGTLATLLQELAMTPKGLTGTGYDGDDLDELLNMLNGDGGTGAPEKKRKKFNVTVTCTDENDQQQTLQRLLAAGFNARIK